MTTIINVKVKNIRPNYNTLFDWMNNKQHEYIGRPGIVFINGKRFPKKASQWQNPFTVTEHGRDKCLELYEKFIRDKIDTEGTTEILKLKNKILGCWV